MVAELYKIEGDLLLAQNQNQEAILDYKRSLTIFLEISLSGKYQAVSDLDDRINELYLKLSVHELPVEIRYQLFDYYEKRGNYIKVEEQISNLLNKDGQVHETLPGIINYYESILKLSDKQLSAGGVTRLQTEERLDSAIRLGKGNE